MKYYIDYKKNTSEILGFLTDLNKTQAMGILQEVSKEVFDTQMNKTNNNKIIIDGENISFDKVDWRTPEEIEVERIQLIKAKAGDIIKSKYSIEWQLNNPRLDVTYASQYVWIDSIRNISNESESNGTALEDIDWGI